MSAQDVHEAELRQQFLAARSLRERMWADPHRPRYHLLPPEGFFNDANGAIYWNSRYHVFYLGRVPVPGPDGTITWREIWDHSSSHDLVHWMHHPPALYPKMDGSTPHGIYSGGAIKNAPIPTMIYHVPFQGTCIATIEDPDLVTWEEHPANPVISEDQNQEYVVMDPCGWYEDGVYYALIGNKSNHPEYDGDCTSLFTSVDLKHWEYKGPFYKRNPQWTDAVEDCACPDFCPLGDQHMLLMHGHRPYGQVHYYLGSLRGDRYFPEVHGRMNWPGGQLSGPETLEDDSGRRIFFGWIREARDWRPYGWGSVMSLPRIFDLDGQGQLRIRPVPELVVLRGNKRSGSDLPLEADQPVVLQAAADVCSELSLDVDMDKSSRFTVFVRQSPDGEEQTAIVIDRSTDTVRIELARSSTDPAVQYPYSGSIGRSDGEQVQAQVAPFALAPGENVCIQLFLDRSVLEVFINQRQCLTQRIYPARPDSLGISVAADNSAMVKQWQLWDMAQTTA